VSNSGYMKDKSYSWSWSISTHTKLTTEKRQKDAKEAEGYPHIRANERWRDDRNPPLNVPELLHQRARGITGNAAGGSVMRRIHMWNRGYQMFRF